MFSRQLLDSAETLLWVWLTQPINGWLSFPPPTQPGLTELQSPISHHQLSKGLMSRRYFDSAQVAESGCSSYQCNLPPPTQQGFAVPIPDTYIQYTDSVDNNWVGLTLTQLRDSAEEDGWVWLLTHSSGTQQKKMTKSGTWHTAQGLSRRR